MFYVKKDFVKTVLFKMIVAMLSLENKRDIIGHDPE